MSNMTRTIDNHSRAPDAGYVRSDAELAHQRAYEAKESSRTDNTIQITYRIEKSQQQQRAGGKVGDAFCVVRKVGDKKEETSATVYRHVEAINMLKEGAWRDKMAAKRLGLDIHVVTPKR